MEAVKRVEIVILSVRARSLCQEIDALGLSGYTVLRGAEGVGHRGVRFNDELTDVNQNTLILLACPEARLDEVIAVVRPALSQFGGICLVSDAMSVLH